MTEEIEIKDVLKQLDRADKGTAIGRGLDSLVGKSLEAAEKEMRTYGREFLTNESFAAMPDGTPRYTQAQFDALTPEEQETKLRQATAWRAEDGLKRGVDALKSGLKDYVESDDGVKLAKIANVKDIVENAADKQRPLLEAYLPLARYEKLAKQIENGENPAIEDKEDLKEIAQSAVAQRVRKALGGKYNGKLVKLATELALPEPSEELTRKDQLDGLKYLIEQKRKGVLKIVGEDGIETRVAAAVGTALDKMLASGNQEQERNAANLVYRANTGYSIGERALNQYKKAA